jgi:hypothetical protein
MQPRQGAPACAVSRRDDHAARMHVRRMGAEYPVALGPARSAARIGPALPDQVSTPAQQSPRGDDQAQLAEIASGQEPGQRGQNRPVGSAQPRGLHLALEHGDLVTQDQELRILVTVGAGKQREPAEHPQCCQIGES